LSRNTVALAYELLQLEGYVESKTGDGTRVAQLQLGPARPADRQGKNPDAADGVAPPTAVVARGGAPRVLTASPAAATGRPTRAGLGPFLVGQPDVAHFPYMLWARLVARNARRSLHSVALYQNAQGYAPLREAIAAHVGMTRGVHCSPDQIIMTAGSQGALDLIARVLLASGDPVWVEEPGYTGARRALQAAGARLVPVPVDREGIDVDAGQRLCRQARMAVVTPSHQFPTGVTMSLSRRLALLDWSRATGAWIVEDDYDSDYRFGGRPLEALQGLDSCEQVIYVGTFSKVLYPSLRLGYLVAPVGLIDSLCAARAFVDGHLPLLEQLALADFMAEGQFARYVAKMRQLYLERRNALVGALSRELAARVDVVVPEAGLHLAAMLPAGVSAQPMAEQAALHGLHVTSLARYAIRPLQRDGLMLGFACATPDELRAGVHRLGIAFQSG
jgi:GntR family transcriptional regulator/MocR family aminotransferase